MFMRNIVVLTGAAISAESGLSTFRDSDGLWEKHPVSRVATHEAWETDPEYVNEFYNMLRAKLVTALPNDGHKLVAELEKDNNVTVITQNVDNLHEMAGSTRVIHLHGELMKVCSSRDVDNPHFIRTLTPPDINVYPGDGSLLRPYIVFFGEAVPNISVAAEEVNKADVLIIIGTSLNVYPAAGLVQYVRAGVPIYLIDPKPAMISGIHDVTQIACGAGEGMHRLMKILRK